MIFESPYPDAVISEIPVGTRLLQKLGTYGDRIALVNGYNGKVITFSQLRRDVIEYAATLWSIGVQKGDVVMLFVPLVPEYIAVIIAISICGATFNFLYSTEDKAIVAQVELLKPRLIIPENTELIKIDLSCHVYTLQNIQDLQSTLDPKTRVFPVGVMIDVHEDPVVIINSSGTTGKSKGIVHTHYGINAAIDQYLGDDFDQTDCVFVCFPRFHYWVVTILFRNLFRGIKEVLCAEMGVSKVHEVVAKTNVTRMITSNVPMLVDLAEKGKVPALSTLQYVCFGGMPFLADTKRKIKMELGIDMFNLYGSSENGIVSFYPKQRCPVDSVGKLLSNYKLRIVNAKNGKDLGYNEHGEIWTKSSLTMKCYIKPQGDDRFVKDSAGWCHSGDVGYVDENGYLFVIDRIKFIINGIGGVSMYPSEIESLLSKHPHVKDVAVIGVKHPIYSEAVKAFVVRRCETADPEEIIAFYNDQVADAKKIRGGLEFIDVLPRIGIGKVDRRKLMEQHKANQDCRC